jgi:hypothetical protein
VKKLLRVKKLLSFIAVVVVIIVLSGCQSSGNKEISLKEKVDNLTIVATNGQATIAQAQDIFSWIDLDFKNWNLDKPNQKTPEIKTQVHEMVQNANFKQMFSSLSSDLDRLCLTQSQIIEFCKKYPSHLSQDCWATFFLFKINNQYFVADVFIDSDGLNIFVFHFKLDWIWSGGHRHRLVIPQMKV